MEVSVRATKLARGGATSIRPSVPDAAPAFPAARSERRGESASPCPALVVAALATRHHPRSVSGVRPLCGPAPSGRNLSSPGGTGTPAMAALLCARQARWPGSARPSVWLSARPWLPLLIRQRPARHGLPGRAAAKAGGQAMAAPGYFPPAGTPAFASRSKIAGLCHQGPGRPGLPSRAPRRPGRCP